MMFLYRIWFLLCVIQASIVPCVFGGSKLQFQPHPVRFGQRGPYTYPIGTAVELICTVTATDLNSSALVLQHGDLQLPVNRTSKTIRYVIPKGETGYSGLYRCSVGHLDEGFPFTKNSVSFIITFGPLPSKPQRFRCVSYNYSNLVCSWEVSGANDTTNYWVSRFTYDSYVGGTCENSSTSSSQFPCPCGSRVLRTGIEQTKRLQCTVRSGVSTIGPFLQFENYHFQVWGYNQYGDSFWNYSVFTDTSIVKLPSAYNLHSVWRNSTTIHVVWELRSTLLTNIEFEVLVTKLGSRDQWEYMNTTTTDALVGNLTPFTEYSVLVRGRPRGGRYWSDPSTVNVTTTEASPSSAPVSTPGAFCHIPCGESTDCVWVYWKPIKQQFRNGIIIKYTTSTADVHHSVTIHPEPSTETYSTELKGLPKGLDNLIEIYGENSQGSSPKYHLIVPSATKAPVKPRWVVVEILNTSCETYQITWQTQPRDYSDDDNTTLFWCLGVAKRNYVECKAGLDWVVLPPNMTMYTVSPHTDKMLQTAWSWYFGVAIDKNNTSSGITWNKCIFKFNGGASKPAPLSVAVIGPTRVEVSWHFSYCDTSRVQGRPQEYSVAYNKLLSSHGGNCTGGFHQSEPASFDSTSMLLSGLDHRATYQVCMRIKTRLGFSPYSDPVMVKIKPPDDATGYPVVIGVSVSFGVVVFVVVLCLVKHRKIVCSPCTKLKIDLSLLHEEERKGTLFGVSNVSYTYFPETIKVISQDMIKKYSGFEGEGDSNENTEHKNTSSMLSNVLSSSSVIGDSNIFKQEHDINISKVEVTMDQCNYQGQTPIQRTRCDSGFSSVDLTKDKVHGMSAQPDVSTTSYVKVDINSNQYHSSTVSGISDSSDCAVFQENLTSDENHDTHISEMSDDPLHGVNVIVQSMSASSPQHPNETLSVGYHFMKDSDYVSHADMRHLEVNASGYARFYEHIEGSHGRKDETLSVLNDDNDDDIAADDDYNDDDDDYDHCNTHGSQDDSGGNNNNEVLNDSSTYYPVSQITVVGCVIRK